MNLKKFDSRHRKNLSSRAKRVKDIVDDARKRAKQCSLVKRMIDEYYPEAVWSPKGSLV